MNNNTYISYININQIKMMHIATSALSGIVAAGIFNLPYIFWAEAARLPFHAWFPYFIYTLIAGAIAGIITIYYKYGIAIGTFIYAILPFLLGAISTKYDFIGPPEFTGFRLSTGLGPDQYYLLYAGYCISYAALEITRFVSKRRYQQVDIPPDSYDNPLFRIEGLATGVFAVTMIISIIYGWQYFSLISNTRNSPQAAVASFCWMIGSRTNHNLDSYEYLFAKQSFEVIQANLQFFKETRTSIKLPSRNNIRRNIVSGDYDHFQEDKKQYNQTAIINVLANDETAGRKPASMQFPMLKLQNYYITSFYLIKENGDWQIYSLPITKCITNN
ncbi:MAG: hypothetical protein ACYC27_21745 [Armatimonadota bacterium]